MRSNLPHAVTALAAAAWALVAAPAPGLAAIVTSGQVSPDPAGGSFTGFINIGNTGAGSVTINGGSVLSGQRLGTGGVVTGTGAVTVTGAGSSFVLSMDRLPASNFLNTTFGNQGSGSLSVLNGGSFVNGLDNADCRANCRLYFSNGAGSQGTLLVGGAGSNVSTPGSVRVGYASLFTVPVSGFAYGTVGGASTGQASVNAGASVTSSILEVGRVDDVGSEAKGSESATGNVLIDGIGSIWNLVRNATQSGSRALLSLGSGRNASGTVNVANGGKLLVDGSVAAGEFTGISVAAPAATAKGPNVNGSLAVTGAGSSVEFVGGRGLLGVGRSAGADGELRIAAGGVVSGVGTETGLTYVDIGKGGTGRATVSGAGSLLQLNGRNSITNTFAGNVPGGGAFLNVGRTESIAGNGSLNISAGGWVVVDTTAVALTNTNGRTGFGIGWDDGSVGSASVNGAGSELRVDAGTGLTPYAAVGRNGGSGALTVSGGGQVVVNSSHVSVPNPITYLNGDITQLDIARRTDAGTAGTTGTVTVTGAGSRLSFGGAADNLINVGRGNNASGTLNVLDGGSVQTQILLVGQDSGATGTVNLNGGQLAINGVLNGGPFAGEGGGVIVGRNGGVGVLNASGGSTLTVSSTAPRAAVRVGGSEGSPGGSGTLNVGGGSTVVIHSSNAELTVGTAGTAALTGVGALNLTGAGSSITVAGSGSRALIGAGTDTLGTAFVGTGASLIAEGLIGVAHDGSANTGGIGTLIVNGSATAPTLVVGSGGLLGGSGAVNANVINHGILSPANSPGRLTVNGSLDSSDGKIVLEVQSLGNGQFAYDELFVSNWADSALGAAQIEFNFLDDTNPADFLGQGLFTLGSFFKEDDGAGGVRNLDTSRVPLFQGVTYSALARNYNISGIGFGNDGRGVFTAASVPVPQTLALVLLGLVLMQGLAKVRARLSSPAYRRG